MHAAAKGKVQSTYKCPHKLLNIIIINYCIISACSKPLPPSYNNQSISLCKSRSRDPTIIIITISQLECAECHGNFIGMAEEKSTRRDCINNY